LARRRLLTRTLTPPHTPPRATRTGSAPSAAPPIAYDVPSRGTAHAREQGRSADGGHDPIAAPPGPWGGTSVRRIRSEARRLAAGCGVHKRHGGVPSLREAVGRSDTDTIPVGSACTAQGGAQDGARGCGVATVAGICRRWSATARWVERPLSARHDARQNWLDHLLHGACRAVRAAGHCVRSDIPLEAGWEHGEAGRSQPTG
jgi:hypothetical protein